MGAEQAWVLNVGGEDMTNDLRMVLVARSERDSGAKFVTMLMSRFGPPLQAKGVNSV